MKYTVLLLFLFSYVYVNGQTSSQDQFVPQFDNKFLPHSPEAAALGKYGIVPVNYATGLPNISIPLYTLKTKNIEVPLSLSYHSSGFKPRDKAEWLGLGWSLSGYGVITRVVNGLVDEHPSIGNRYEDYPRITALSSRQYYLDKVYKKEFDSEPDLYIYNFNGYTGKFLLIKGKVFMIDIQDLKISWIQNGFRIKTPDGNNYEFTAAEVTKPKRLNPGDPFIPEHVSAWFLTKIYDMNDEHHVNFTYTDYTHQDNDANYSETIQEVLGPLVVPPWESCQMPQDRLIVSTYPGAVIESKRLSSISTDTESITFNSGSILEKIVVKNLQSQKSVKVFGLINEYFGASINTQRLKLKKVVTADLSKPESLSSAQQMDLNSDDKYTFEYYDEGGSFPLRETKGIDMLGYYNGKDNNQSLFPIGSTHIPFPLANADRSPSFADTKKGVLKKITYPSKGSTVFQYEQNIAGYEEPHYDNHATATEVVSTFVEDPLYPDKPTISSGSFLLTHEQDVTLTFSRSIENFDPSQPSNLYKTRVPIVEITIPNETTPQVIIAYQSPQLFMELSRTVTVHLAAGYYNFFVRCEKVATSTTATVFYSTRDTTPSPGYIYPGLRISSIESSDDANVNLMLTKKYEYLGDNGSSSGRGSFPGIGVDMSTKDVQCDDGSVGVALFVYTLTFYNHTSSYSSGLSGMTDQDFYYTKVTEKSSATNSYGQVDYYYQKYGTLNNIKLSKQIDHKWSGTVMKKVRSVENTYAERSTSYFPSFKSKLTHINIPNIQIGGFVDRCGDMLAEVSVNVYANEINQNVYPTAVLLKSTVSKTFNDQGDALIETQDYSYENTDHLLPTKIFKTKSNSDKILLRNAYVMDYNITAENLSTIDKSFFTQSANAINDYETCDAQRQALVLNKLQIYLSAIDTYYNYDLDLAIRLAAYNQITPTYNEYVTARDQNKFTCEDTFKNAYNSIFANRNSRYSNYDFTLQNGALNASDNNLKTLSFLQSKYAIGQPIERTEFVITDTDTLVVKSVISEFQMRTTNKLDLSKVYALENSKPILKQAFTSSGFYYQDDLRYFQKDSRYTPRLNYHSYDASGNILTTSMENNTKESYIWDTDGNVTSKVNNANYTDIAFTSFEEGENGNWTVSSVLRNNTASITGERSYSLANGSVSKTVNATTNYKLTFWYKVGSGSVLVNGITYVSGSGGTQVRLNTSLGWDLVDVNISNATSITISGSATVDELRLAPVNSQITSYTYFPGVGIASSNDANNMITYFTYDSFGRLTAILDKNKSLIKTYTYNLKK